jgi:tRNA uridine 5-carbamoylmethylation protein Kti12
MPRRIDFDKLDKKYPAMPTVQSRYLSRIPGLILMSGHCGSGKSVLAIALIQKLRREGSVNRVFVVSPTASSNAIYDAICTNPDKDQKINLKHAQVFEDIKRVEEMCEADAAQYYDDLEYAIVRKSTVTATNYRIKTNACWTHVGTLR